MRKLSKKTLAVATTVVLLSGGGAAFAYWTTSGTGSGTAATSGGTINQLTFTQATGVTAMYPGDSPQTLTVGVKNTGTESTYVTSVKAYITTNKSGCTGADFKLGGVATGTPLAPTGLTWTAADLAANGTANATSTIQFNNTSANQDACKTAVVTVNYVAS